MAQWLELSLFEEFRVLFIITGILLYYFRIKNLEFNMIGACMTVAGVSTEAFIRLQYGTDAYWLASGYFSKKAYEVYYFLKAANMYMKYTIVGILVITLFRIIFYRYVKLWWGRFSFSNIRSEFNPKDQRKIDLQFKGYNFHDYFEKSLTELFFRPFFFQSRREIDFFIGRLHKTGQPVYISEEDAVCHIQVIGKTGSGKTESALKPLAFQNSFFLNPTIFVDGKADQELVRFFYANYRCGEKYEKTDRKFLNFNSIQVHENGQPIDVLKTSNTFNPLMAFDDESKLTDMISMALELESDGAENFYFDLQKMFLKRLFTLFLATGKKFTFEDITEFIMYPESRKYTYSLAVTKGKREQVSEMSKVLDGLKNGYPELLGLYNKLDSLFVSDKTISKLVNVYESEINIKQSLFNKDFVLFSVSCGDRFQSNRAISKMVISILSSLVGEKVGYEEKPFWMMILDEFGTYTSPAMSPLITTARDTNTSIVLSYQTDALLNQVEGLSDIVKSSTGTKFIFNSAESADDYAKYFGTIESTKKSYVVEEDLYATETMQGRSSNREVDEFNIQPNVFRSLLRGQSVCKYPSNKSGMAADIMDHAMIKLDKKKFRLDRELNDNSGLDLKKNRMCKDTKQNKEAVNLENSDEVSDSSVISLNI